MSAPQVQVQSVAEVLTDVQLGTRVYRVPPGELVVGRNTRVTVREDREFAASISSHGVLQPITCYVLDDRLVVELGQRRTLAATREGLPWVPVVLTAAPDEQGRLIEQLAENEHRAPITTADRAAAVAQLSLLGLTAEQLVARTALRRVDVDHALAVAGSAAASAAAAAHPITLDQAAAIAEFDDDPDVVDELTAAAANGGFAHVVERAREDREDEAAQNRLLEQLAAAGVRIVEREQVRDDAVRPLDWLRLGPDEHASCPGHAGYASNNGHYVDGRWEHGWHAVYVCTQAALHTELRSHRAASLADEQARVDRGEVMERNRQWRTATRVRRRWLADFARGRTVPDGAERWIAATMLAETGWYSDTGEGVLAKALTSRHRLLRDVLRRPDDDPADDTDAESSAARDADMQALLAAIEGGSARKALRLTCALLLAAWEARADVHVWRNPTPQHRYYLGQMITWGYEPAPVEQLVIRLDLTEGQP